MSFWKEGGPANNEDPRKQEREADRYKAKQEVEQELVCLVDRLTRGEALSADEFAQVGRFLSWDAAAALTVLEAYNHFEGDTFFEEYVRHYDRYGMNALPYVLDGHVYNNEE